MVSLVSGNQISADQRLHPAPVGKPRLLLVSDSAERMIELRSLLNSSGVEITDVISLEDLVHACRVQHSMAIVDVGPERMIEVLEALRNNREHTAIPLLVEAVRVSTESSPDVSLAGVMPKYRAMPCSRSEMIGLISRLFADDGGGRKARGIL